MCQPPCSPARNCSKRSCFMLLAWLRKLTYSHSQEGKRRQRTPAVRQPSRGLQLERLEDRLAPATHTWTGAVNNFWSNDATCRGGSPAPDANADLIFPYGAQYIAK